jgi:hypothetical protein
MINLAEPSDITMIKILSKKYWAKNLSTGKSILYNNNNFFVLLSYYLKNKNYALILSFSFSFLNLCNTHFVLLHYTFISVTFNCIQL